MYVQVLSGLVSSLRLPSTAIFQWLDSHVQACYPAQTLLHY